MATYYLNSDTGNNANPGTSGSPWLTMAYALTNSTAGDTLYLQNSTATFLFANENFTARTVQGQSAAGAVFDGAGAGKNWNISTVGATYTFINLTFQNILNPGSGTPVFYTTTGGAATTYNFTNCIFKSNTITGTAGSFDGMFAPYYTAAYTLNFTGCLFYGNTLNGHLISMREVVGGTLTMTNCTFYSSSAITIPPINCVSATGGTMTIKNCIWFNGSTTIALMTSVTGFTITYTTNCTVTFSAVPSGTGNITSNPLFIDQANALLSLRPTSPCLDTASL